MSLLLYDRSAGSEPAILLSGGALLAGTVLPEGTRVLLVLHQPNDLWEAPWQLLRIGYGLPLGWLAGGMATWRTSGAAVHVLPQITVHELKDKLGRQEVRLLDVRQPAEWSEGHVEMATFVTGAELPERSDEIPEGPLAVTCGSGYRSSVSASLLQSRGRHPVFNVLGGMAAWRNAGYPTTST